MRKVVKTWVGGVGLLVAFQIFMQWQLELEISLTPYEIGLYLAFLAALLTWIWLPEDRVRRPPKPIAEDTGGWHFGRNAPILAIGVVALIVLLAFLAIVLPPLDPIIDTTLRAFITVPLALVGVGSLSLDAYQKRRGLISSAPRPAGPLTAERAPDPGQ